MRKELRTLELALARCAWVFQTRAEAETFDLPDEVTSIWVENEFYRESVSPADLTTDGHRYWTRVEFGEEAAAEALAAAEIAVAAASIAGMTPYGAAAELPTGGSLPANDTWAGVYTANGLQAWRVVAGAWALIGWVTRPQFDTEAELEDSTYTSLGPTGTVLWAGASVYEVVTADQHLTTLGGVKLTRMAQSTAFSGLYGEPNTRTISNSAIQQIGSGAEACHIVGGTAGLPNRIGYEYAWDRTQGDGSAAYTLTFPFSVTEKSYSPRVVSIRRADNAYTPVTVNSITGYGTNTITITLSANLSSDYDLFTQVSGDDELAAGESRLSSIFGGYNNDGGRLMNTVFGAHCRVGSEDGHCSILGGSNNLILGGSYVAVGGTNVIAGENDSSATGMVGLGTNLVVDGRGATAFGNGNTVSGNGTFAAGEGNDVTAGGSAAFGNGNSISGVGSAAVGYTNTVTANYAAVTGLSNTVGANYSMVYGRSNSVTAGDYSLIAGWENTSGFAFSVVSGNKAVSRNTAQQVHGYGGTDAGSRQSSRMYSAGQSTSASTISLTKTGGAALAVGLNSAARIKGTVIGRDKNNLEGAAFDIDALILVNGSGTTTIVAGGTPTLVHNSAGLAGVSASLLVGTAGVTVRITGLAATTINWLAVADITEIATGAQ